MKFSIFGLVVILSFYSAVSSASSFGGGRSLEGGTFFGADLNRDERLSKDEAKAVHNLAEDEIFTRYDEDKSGFITRLEFKEFFQQKPWVDKFVHPRDRK